MARDEYKKPFDDEFLIYDVKRHRYLLNKDYIVNIYGETSNLIIDDKKWIQLQNDLSDNVYSFIYSFKQGRENYDHMEYELANNQFYREVLSDVLLWQYQYAITTGGDTIQLQHGFNPASEKMNKVEDLRNELMISTKGYLKLHEVGLLENTFRENFDYSLYRKDY